MALGKLHIHIQLKENEHNPLIWSFTIIISKQIVVLR